MGQFIDVKAGLCTFFIAQPRFAKQHMNHNTLH